MKKSALITGHPLAIGARYCRVACLTMALPAMFTIAGCAHTASGQVFADGTATDQTSVNAAEANENEAAASAQDLIAAGDDALRAGDTDKALFEYLRALELNPVDRDIYFNIGLVHEFQGNYTLAEAAYKKCAQLDGNYIAALERLGTMQLRQRNYPLAKQNFSRAIELDRLRLNAAGTEPASTYAHSEIGAAVSASTPKYDAQSPFYAYSGLGVIEDIEGNHHQAMVAFQAARSIKPDSVHVFNNMGYSSYMANDLDVAEIMFKKSVALQPDYKVGWRNLALVYVRRGQYEDAIEILSSKVESEAAAYNTVGYLCMLDGKYETAELFFSEAITLAPAYFEAANENLKKNRQLYSAKSD